MRSSKGTNLVCVKDGINGEAQMGKMMIAFMSAFAEMERENILVQTMAGREQKAREGKRNGGQAPFGYKLVKDEKGKGHLEIDESEAEIVRIIFHEYTKNGKGVMTLASWLNARGPSDLRGAGWRIPFPMVVSRRDMGERLLERLLLSGGNVRTYPGDSRRLACVDARPRAFMIGARLHGGNAYVEP
uniref:recombinase family protein n=1 Tax=Bifidobacterium longum TaxID=216816 RepID=UPI00359C8330